ncbi:intermembrane lipid transfer protein VPS13B isoform X2 [Onthophagus taurus]|uniref:intermembrane lipid transfer protein VPS13B isoform X2 n=1 Tax=Onthophagus taurus TaxID=166361 RepID=UPI0039BDF73C
MFKLESYITPLILSYVDKYIKNFRLEDSQVSLWGGDASFHNLDLRLEVLEQELQLPFSFVSGHIHELSIHVPWTKLTSEPISITINTIECILKLRSTENDKPSEPPKEKPKKIQGKKHEVEAPPSYVHALINKIVSNIRIYCNNLILKYVEEDIVLSMNIKLLTYESCDEKWEPTYSDSSPAQVTMRKLITVNDLTICLDKRNASGKIDVYQEPMLYRCSLTMHFLRTYQSSNISKASTTRFDIYCNNMEFSMTEQQIPMVIRLVLLACTLGGNDMKSEHDVKICDETSYEAMVEPNDTTTSWAGWIWSFVPSIRSSQDEPGGEEQPIVPTGHTLHIGFYVDTTCLVFKVSESSSDRSYYSQKKLKYYPLLLLKVQGLYSETIIHGLKWVNAKAGIGNIEIQPLGLCTCGVVDIFEENSVQCYFSAGSVTENHKTDSLFDAEAVENKGQRKLYNVSWDYHVAHVTETTMLDRTAAFAVDFVHEVVVPDDMTSDQLSDITNLEYSNILVRTLLRIVVGPIRVKVCAGLIHRVECMVAAASAYDYAPYIVEKSHPPSKVDLQPPSTDDYDALNENIPIQVMQYTIIAPVIEVHLFDHPKFESTKSYLFRKRKKLSTIISPSQQNYAYLPKLTIECQCIDVKVEGPIYTKKLVHTVCQLPDPPRHMFDACYQNLSVKVLNFCSKLILGSNTTTIITPFNATFRNKNIISPEYWVNPDTPHNEMRIYSESIGINSTKPRAILIGLIIEKMTKFNCEEAIYFISNTSILQDASKSYKTCLEFSMEEMKLHKVSTKTTLSINVSLDSIKAFIFDPLDNSSFISTRSHLTNSPSCSRRGSFTQSREIQQVLFISGPDSSNDSNNDSTPLFKCSLQIPLDPDRETHPSIMIFNLQEIRVCVDPLLCSWFLYTPVVLVNFKSDYSSDIRKIKSSSEIISTVTGIETPRRLVTTPHESVHSSSDRDREILQLPKTPKYFKEEEQLADPQERIYCFLSKWFPIWQAMMLFGDLSQCTIYFPTESLSAIGSQGIQQAVDEAMQLENPPDMLVITLPCGNLRSAGTKDNILEYTRNLPIKLPNSLWNPNKSNFPWNISISDISCYSWQKGTKLDLLKPVSFNATVGMCSKNKPDNLKDQQKEDVSSTGSENNSLSGLGVCIHIDMSPTKIILSEIQVCLIASILYGLIEVINNLAPDTSEDQPQPPRIIPVINAQPSFTASPTFVKESSLDSTSEQSPRVTINTDNINTEHIKLTAWIQWTITKFTIEMLSYKLEDMCKEDFNYTKPLTLKLVVEAEDVVSSLDFQSIFMKIKSKIGAASIQHYLLDPFKNQWIPGNYLGFIMKTREEILSQDTREDNCFASIIITRASCQHTHNLWGTKNTMVKEDETSQHPNRFISEVVVTLQAIDFLLCLPTLRSFSIVFEPLLQIPSSPSKVKETEMTVNISNRVLPLIYLDCKGFRVIVPLAELENVDISPDVCIFQVDGINLMPDPVNPICRTPIRADIYQQAARSRILNIPGSEIEDRQYELKIVGISLSTSTWSEFDPLLHQSSSMKQLKTMSENPALEWNLGKGTIMKGQNVNFVPIINKFDVLIVTAPAMIYKNEVICGHSIEINFVSNIETLISLNQIKFFLALENEVNGVYDLCVGNAESKRPKVFLPYSCFNKIIDTPSTEIQQIDLGKDSGIETREFRSIASFKSTTEIAINLKRVSAAENIYTKPCVKYPYGYIPLDLLITAGKINFILYNNTNDARKDLLNYDGRKDSENFEESEEYFPYIFASICQPNIFMSDLQLGRKIQGSCYDVKLKLPEIKQLKSMPIEKNFNTNLVETRTGYPNPHNGVLPAFFTARWSKGVGKPNLEIEIAKPVKIVASVAICTHLINVVNAINETLIIPEEPIVIKSINTQQKSRLKQQKSVDYVKFKEIKDKLLGVTVFNVKLSQVVFNIKTENDNELTLTLGKIKNYLTISNRPERITNVTTLNSICIGVSTGDVSRLLLNPWTISLEVCLFWESWQSVDSDPQIQISGQSDCIVIDVSPEQLQCIEFVQKEIAEFIASLPLPKNNPVETYDEPLKPIPSDKEQHYKDDLRAGAFHFVDSTSNNIDELPLPYRVMFWHKNISAMAWRYPQPRALTKVRVFPVPYNITQDSKEKILCNLEYWSECHGSYQPYTQFYLSESEMCQLDLPQNNQPVVASIWRIVLTSTITDARNRVNYTRVLLSPRALAGCIRVDSYFNKVLVPQLTLSLHISTISINLFNRLDKTKNLIMPEQLKNYTPDQLFPELQNFMTITLDNTRVYLATWNFEIFSIDLISHIKCTILDYAFLTMQPLILPFTFKFEASISKSININFISKPISINLGATAAHTLAVSGQLWYEFLTNDDNSMNLIVMTQYVVCNDTNVTLRFGQAGSEDILLLPRYCHLYAWRSQKSKLMLRVALEEYGWVWSEAFRIDSDGTAVLNISKENNIVVIMSVRSLSATQKKITFSGQLSICNTLLEHFELKVVENVMSQKDAVFKSAPVHIISGKSTPPSILIDSTKKYFLRLRFYGLDSAWSGDIPLAANPKCTQPWLVKVPLQERGQFLSIWCQIETQHFESGCKILAILSPLFMVRSNLAINSKIFIETPMLHVHLESTVRGKGEYQQLYCPGTIDHSHQLTFQLDDTPTSNPYVPLNYSLVDQKVFFKKKDKVDIDEILDVLNNYTKSSWPYFGEDFEGIDFLIEDQPLTHVQVKYENACLYSSALLMELLPWCLLLNTTGCPIAIIVNEKELCRVNHYGICTPPKLEETFYLGVGINGMWNLTLPLQLAKSNWSTAFYMPKISGNIPLEGNIKTMVKCEPYVCMISIISNVENTIRLLRVSSTHVVTNHTSLNFRGVCFAVPVTGSVYNFPKKTEQHSFNVPCNLNTKSSGVSITQWYVIGKTIDPMIEYVLYISFSTNGKSGWSCPIRVDKPFNRRSISVKMNQKSIPIVVVSQEYKGQSFLSLHYDSHPQLQIKNRSGVKLYCAQYADNDGRLIVEDCEDMKWLCSVDDESSCYYTMPDLSVLFPDVALNANRLVLAADPEGDPKGFQWSQPILVTNFNDQFVRIPYYGDVKVSVKSTAYTTVLFVESVTKVEIHARDIRVRLSRHEIETTAPISSRANDDPAESTSLQSTYFSAEEILSDSSGNKNMVLYSKVLPTLAEQSNPQQGTSTTPSSSEFDLQKESTATVKRKDTWNNFKVQVFIKAIIFTLTSDLESCGAEKTEVCALTCDNIALVLNRTDNLEVHFSLSNMQVDNQLYFRETYDFPVILISKNAPPNQPLNSLNVQVNQLISNAKKNALINVYINFEIWTDPVRLTTITSMTEVHIKMKPFAVYVEDTYMMKLIEQFSILNPTNLVIWRKETNNTNKFDTSAMLVYVPLHLIWTSNILSSAISIRSFVIEPISVLLSAHCSMKIYVALDESPLEFGKFDKTKIVTTSYKLGNAITMHYLSGAIFGAGWVVGSLELLGSPGGLARAMGAGLKDFINLPYQGLMQGPWGFIVGITHGFASLMMHVTAGTLQSVTKLASSVARNLDRMTMDEEHLRRTEEQRRQRPQSVGQGLFQGLTGLGINLLGAIGGIAHHPIQSMRQVGPSPRSLVSGVGRGLVGIITKPLSGAADLVALTGQGLLYGAGWKKLPNARSKASSSHVFSSSNSCLKYCWKFMPPITKPNVLFVTEATSITIYGQYEAVALILTTEVLIIVNTDDDLTQKVIKLEELCGIENNADPTLLMLKLVPIRPVSSTRTKLDDCPGELDPISKARIQDYVRNTVGFITFSDASSQHSDISISPDISVDETVEETTREQTGLNFYVNPQNKNYFLCLLSLAKQQHEPYNFPVL